MIYLKLFTESVLFAIHSLRVNRLRTTLSLLGISIGIFTIISVFTAVDSLEHKIKSSVESLGDNVIYIQKWPWTFGPNYAWWDYLKRPQPGFREMQKLEDKVTYVEAMAFLTNIGGVLVKYRNNNITDIGIVGVSHDYDKVRPTVIEKGRYFTEIESNLGKNVAIIGYTVAGVLFGDKNPVGETIHVKNRKFTVIGVIEKEGESMVNNSYDEGILIPLNYARTVINVRSDSHHSFIIAKAKDGIPLVELENDLRGAMRSLRRQRPLEKDSFALNKASMLMSLLTPMFILINLIGWIIGGFSVLVGGFGIANIMFVSVKEQTNIIGIQKALGAKNYFILIQFLFESIALCMMGGVI